MKVKLQCLRSNTTGVTTFEHSLIPSILLGFLGTSTDRLGGLYLRDATSINWGNNA
jgi:hypothetical protein